ncbi:MAG TPA: PilN domain-containing protein [Planctomycetaceae bacterium]|nr:PilN domain-containing protein [Planctomycetaceae bacterium]
MLFTVLTLASMAHSWQGRSLARQELELWNRRAATIESIHETNQRLRQRIAALDTRLIKYQDLHTDRLGFQVLATVSRSAQLSGGDVQVRTFSYKQLTLAPEVLPKGEAKPAGPRESHMLSLHGVAKSNLQLAHFVSALRDSGAFLRVDLKSSHGKKNELAGTRTYQVDCAF